MSKLTASRLREVLSYSPDTGTFHWLLCHANSNWDVGDVAGRVNVCTGYHNIGIDGCDYATHRLAYLYMTGEWPSHHVDHINMVKHDNRWCNLRAATMAQNKANSRARSASGFKGVYTAKYRGKITYRAEIRSAGKLHHLGRYKTPEEANAAYAVAASRMHGDFARAE